MKATLCSIGCFAAAVALWLAVVVGSSHAAQRQTAATREVQTAPPFPFRYSGRLERDGFPPLAALTRGADTFLISRGDTIETLYRVEEIDSRHIVVTYLPLKQKQTIELSSAAPDKPSDRGSAQAPAPPKTPLGTPGPACC